MNKNKKSRGFSSVVLTGILIFVTIFLITYMIANKIVEKEKIVPCYDKLGNEIINQRCVEKGIKSDLITIGFFGGLFAGLMYMYHNGNKED